MPVMTGNLMIDQLALASYYTKFGGIVPDEDFLYQI